MNFARRIASFKESQTYKNLKGTAGLKLFGLFKIPLIFIVNPKVRELSDKRCVLEIPLSRITKNHHGSMYFGALAIGADCAAGLFATYKADKRAMKFSLVFKDFKANFIKRPESNVLFICTEADKIDQMLDKIEETRARVTVPIRVEARLPKNQDELIAEFELGLSLKPVTK